MVQSQEIDNDITMDATYDIVDWAEIVRVEQKSEYRQKTLSGSSR
jgi:hypothetical protein